MGLIRNGDFVLTNSEKISSFLATHVFSSHFLFVSVSAYSVIIDIVYLKLIFI